MLMSLECPGKTEITAVSLAPPLRWSLVISDEIGRIQGGMAVDSSHLKLS